MQYGQPLLAGSRLISRSSNATTAPTGCVGVYASCFFTRVKLGRTGETEGRQPRTGQILWQTDKVSPARLDRAQHSATASCTCPAHTGSNTCMSARRRRESIWRQDSVKSGRPMLRAPLGPDYFNRHNKYKRWRHCVGTWPRPDSIVGSFETKPVQCVGPATWRGRLVVASEGFALSPRWRPSTRPTEPARSFEAAWARVHTCPNPAAAQRPNLLPVHR